MMLVRDMEGASKLLVEGIATFSCTELCDYPEFITYAIITNLLYLKRTELKKSIIDGSEVLQVANDIPVVVSLVCFIVCVWGLRYCVPTLTYINPFSHIIASTSQYPVRL